MSWFKRDRGDKKSKEQEPIVHGRTLGSAKRQGDEHARAGRLADAEQCYRQTAESDPEYPGALVMLGFVLRGQGRLQAAQEVLERAVVVSAKDADAHYLLGSVLGETGSNDLTIAHLRIATQLRPEFQIARRDLIDALSRANKISEAIESCEAGIAAYPAEAILHVERGNLHQRAGKAEFAIASYRRALSLEPGMLTAQQSLSRLLFEAGHLQAAEHSYRREIEMTPAHFGPWHMLGVVLSGIGRHAEAVATFQRAIELNPSSGASYASLAAACLEQDDSSEKGLLLVAEYLAKAAALEPHNAEILVRLGLHYARLSRFGDALASFDRAIEADPRNAKARWARVMLWAPPFRVESGDWPSRECFAAELSKFEVWWDGQEDDGAVFVGELQPFYLTYQEEDNLPLLSQYGRICVQAMRRWLGEQTAPAAPRAAENRVRLGIVSADIRLHSIWMALIRGWLQSFDRQRFEIVVFSLASRADAETSWARENADVFLAGPKSLAQWVAAVREQNCEILLYPAVGLDPLTLQLACLRLASVQINSWGHPDTSGLPTLDYYVSGECFEPDNAGSHYSEKLVLLPHLGNRMQPLSILSSEADLVALGIARENPILVCPGTPYKYQPEYDRVLVELARQLPACQFVFFARAGSALGERLRERISKAFEAEGLAPTIHLRFLPWLSFQEFHGLLRCADLLLDTIGFSGYNTAVQAMECGLPMVTREGQYLRGRLASGVLRRMGLDELVAHTEDAYIALAARLVIDRNYRGLIKRHIEAHRSVLFGDEHAMGVFQDFLASVARPTS